MRITARSTAVPTSVTAPFCAGACSALCAIDVSIRAMCLHMAARMRRKLSITPRCPGALCRKGGWGLGAGDRPPPPRWGRTENKTWEQNAANSPPEGESGAAGRGCSGKTEIWGEPSPPLAWFPPPAEGNYFQLRNVKPNVARLITLFYCVGGFT